MENNHPDFSAGQWHDLLTKSYGFDFLVDALKNGWVLSTPELFKQFTKTNENQALVRAALLGSLAREKLKKETEE